MVFTSHKSGEGVCARDTGTGALEGFFHIDLFFLPSMAIRSVHFDEP